MKRFIQIYIIFFSFGIFFYVPPSQNYPFCFGANKQESPTLNLLSNENATNSLILSVLDNGAKGNGVKDDTEAFEKTWDAACKTNGGVMLVPSGFTFLIQPVNFSGSNCQPNVVVQVDGKIVAPKRSNWVRNDLQWVLFNGVSKGLTITGNGVFDGSGGSWWNAVSTLAFRPHSLRIMRSSNVTVTGIRIENSPRMHIYFDYSQYVKIYNFTVSSPSDSPNTDGIHISVTQHVDIHNTTLSCGDDCVSIQNGCSDVRIYNVNCGPGHGYSIGGLGPGKQEAHVSDVVVLNSTVEDSMTGVRIKTWPGGYGTVRNVVFSNITVSNVGTPIVIDQNYCGGRRNCNITNTNGVAISNVTYTSIKGTYSHKSIYFVCSKFNPCRDLKVANVEILPTAVRAKRGTAVPECLHAYGKVLTPTTPSLQACFLS